MKTSCKHQYGHLHVEYTSIRQSSSLRDWPKTVQQYNLLRSLELHQLSRTSYTSPSKNEHIVSLAQLTIRGQYSPSQSTA